MDPELAAEILALETALARRDLTAIPGGPEAILDDAFLEHGASGRRWDREATLEALGDAPPVTVSIAEFTAVTLADGVVLATYRMSHGEPARVSLRSSIWTRRDDEWRLRFHQGTAVDG